MTHLDTSKLALVYIRQSQAVQVKENVWSTMNQLDLTKLAERDGFPPSNIILIDEDLGVSGQTITGRRGMLRALDLIESGTVAAFYCEDITRLSRDRHGVDYQEISRLFRVAGVRLYMQGQWLDLKNEADTLNFDIQAAAAKFYQATQNKKMLTGKLKKFRDKKVISQVGRGYTVTREGDAGSPERDRRVPHPHDAALIRMLADRLPEAGSLRQLYLRTYPLYWHDGTLVTYVAISKALTRPEKRGVAVWGKEVVPDAHPPILTPEQQAAIDATLTLSRQRLGPTKQGAEGHLLVGLVHCPDCDRRMRVGVLHPRHKGKKYQPRRLYQCHNYSPNRTPDRPAKYHFGTLADEIDRAVARDLFRRLSDGLVEQMVAIASQAERQASEAADGRESRAEQLREKLARLTAALTRAEAHGLEDAALPILQEMDAIGKELKAIEAAPVVVRPINARASEYERLRHDPALLNRLPLAWEVLPVGERRDIIRLFVERVDILDRPEYRAVTVHYWDGETTAWEFPKDGWSAEERELFVRLMRLHYRPVGHYMQRVRHEMEAAGFRRSLRALHSAKDKWWDLITSD